MGAGVGFLPFGPDTEPGRNYYRLMANSGTPNAVIIRIDSPRTGKLDIDLHAIGSGPTERPSFLTTTVTLATEHPVKTDSHYSPLVEPLGAYSSPAREFAKTIADLITSAAVYAKITDGVLDLWVILPERDDTVERAIAENACELMRRYPDMSLDFMVIEKVAPSVSNISRSGYVPVSST